MIQTDKIAIASMIKKNADVLSSAAAISGFSLRKGALSFSTGVVVTNDWISEYSGQISKNEVLCALDKDSNYNKNG